MKKTPDLFIPPVSEHQKFKSETIARAQLKNAPYNPRKDLTPEQRKKLETSLSEFGLVQPPVWNKRTGNIVGGHKRVAMLDDLAGGADYSLTVAVVDLDDEKEKALNVVLNSPEVGAQFDESALDNLLAELEGKLTFNLEELISGAQKKTGAKLKKLQIAPPPKMSWVLIGVPLVQYSAIAAHVEAIAKIPDTLVESTFNDPKT